MAVNEGKIRNKTSYLSIEIVNERFLVLKRTADLYEGSARTVEKASGTPNTGAPVLLQLIG